MKKNVLPLVSVIILNWKTKEMTVECIKHIKAQSYKNIEVIVIENGSNDGSVEFLKKIKGIKLIINKENLGFTGGNIVARKSANGKYLLLVNSDAMLPKNYIEIAVQTAENDSKIAAVGGRSYPKKPFTDKSPFYSFQVIDLMTFAGIFNRSDIGIAHETNWVSGSCLLLRNSALDKTGYFYDKFFAYYEESDLFARLKYFGYKIVYNPDLRILHEDGGSSSGYFQYKQLVRNQFIFAIRHIYGFGNITKFSLRYFLLTLLDAFKYVLFIDRGNYRRAQFHNLFSLLPNFTIALRSKKDITKPKNFSTFYKQLASEQIDISFVYEYSTIRDLKQLKSFVYDIAFVHYNSEFLITLKQNSSDIKKLRQFVSKNFPDKLVRILPINGLNIHLQKEIISVSSIKNHLWHIKAFTLPKVSDVISEINRYVDTGRSKHITPKEILNPMHNLGAIGVLLKWNFKYFLRFKKTFIMNLRIIKNLTLLRKDRLRQIIYGIRDELNIKKTLSHTEASIIDTADLPIFIISYNRLNDMKKLIKWLNSIGAKNVYIIDNMSTYPPLLDYYDKINYQVVYMGENLGHTVVWDRKITQKLARNSFYMVTDSDIVPDKNCPQDCLIYLQNTLLKFPSCIKVGLGLKIDDLPDNFTLKGSVVKWERRFWEKKIGPNIYKADVDTTFAVYRPDIFYYATSPSIRTGKPYVARHMPWYVDSSKISSEEKFYRVHARKDITSWNTDALPERYKSYMKKLKIK